LAKKWIFWKIFAGYPEYTLKDFSGYPVKNSKFGESAYSTRISD
jgi:hypothetical protein